MLKSIVLTTSTHGVTSGTVATAKNRPLPSGGQPQEKHTETHTYRVPCPAVVRKRDKGGTSACTLIRRSYCTPNGLANYIESYALGKVNNDRIYIPTILTSREPDRQCVRSAFRAHKYRPGSSRSETQHSRDPSKTSFGGSNLEKKSNRARYGYRRESGAGVTWGKNKKKKNSHLVLALCLGHGIAESRVVLQGLHVLVDLRLEFGVVHHSFRLFDGRGVPEHAHGVREHGRVLRRLISGEADRIVSFLLSSTVRECATERGRHSYQASSCLCLPNLIWRLSDTNHICRPPMEGKIVLRRRCQDSPLI